jgi:hypothetical protein
MDSYCEYNSWSEYFTQLFTTLGLMSGMLISVTVAVPVVSYYSKDRIKGPDTMKIPNYNNN